MCRRTDTRVIELTATNSHMRRLECQSVLSASCVARRLLFESDLASLIAESFPGLAPVRIVGMPHSGSTALRSM